jgi:hypothetical protein
MSDTASDVPLLALSLELKVGNGPGAHLIPVTLKNLSSGMVVLEADNFEGIRNPETLQGKKAILRLTDPKSQEFVDINAIMTWTQANIDKKINVILKILNTQANRPTSKNSLPAASKDTQSSWNLWDETEMTEEHVDHRDNFLLLCLACGTIGSSLLEPKTFQTMQYLLSVIGLGNVIKFLRERY